MQPYIRIRPSGLRFYAPFESVDSRGPSFGSTGFVSRSTLTWLNSLNGFKNPNWRSQIRHNVNATTTMNGTAVAVTVDRKKFYTSARAEYLYNIGYPDKYTINMLCQGDLTADRIPPFQTFTDPSNAAYNHALASFISQVKAVNQELLVGQDLGEIKEVIRTIKHPLQGIRNRLHDYYLKLRGFGSLLHRRDTSRLLSDAWLETVFGIKPLISTVGVLTLDLIDRSRSLERQVVNIRAYGRSNEASVGPTTPVSYGIDQTTRIDVNRISYSYSQVVLRGQVRNFPVHGADEFLIDRYGLSLDEFIPTIWELIPYSFLIDYFANIGSIIESRSTWSTGLLWTNLTHRAIMRDTYQAVPVRLNQGPNFKRWTSRIDVPGSLVLESRRIARTAIDGSMLVPTLEVFTLPRSWRPWANMAALVHPFQRLQNLL